MQAVQIGSAHLSVPVVLAPMAGVTNAPFRRLCADFVRQAVTDIAAEQTRVPAGLPGLYVTEMITSRALVERTPDTLRMIQPDPLESFRSVQLYGVEPRTMAEATRILVGEGWADHVDLNFGCPVPKVTKKGGGAALPWKTELFAEIVSAVVQAAQRESAGRSEEVPVTVKMRTGIDESHLTFKTVAPLAQDLGVSAVALHARTAAQHYSGRAHWEQIGEMVQMLSIPVLGNGDVFEADDALQMVEQTGCAGVVVGRGCQGRPWLFYDLVAAALESSQRYQPNLAGVAEVILRHADLLVEHFAEHGGPGRALREMRKHIGWYLRGFSVGGEARHRLNLVSSRTELEQGLAALDLSQPFPQAAHGPRGRAGSVKTPHLPEGWLDSHLLDESWKERLLGAELGISGG